MSGDTKIRWNLSVSKDTDIAIRTFLAQRDMKKGDISKFVEEAVKWRIFDLTIARVRDNFADLPSAELQVLIDEAVNSTTTPH